MSADRCCLATHLAIATNRDFLMLCTQLELKRELYFLPIRPVPFLSTQVYGQLHDVLGAPFFDLQQSHRLGQPLDGSLFANGYPLSLTTAGVIGLCTHFAFSTRWSLGADSVASFLAGYQSYL